MSPIDPPYRLDPFQNIVDVHWGGQFIMAVRVFINDIESQSYGTSSDLPILQRSGTVSGSYLTQARVHIVVPRTPNSTWFDDYTISDLPSESLLSIVDLEYHADFITNFVGTKGTPFPGSPLYTDTLNGTYSVYSAIADITGYRQGSGTDRQIVHMIADSDFNDYADPFTYNSANCSLDFSTIRLTSKSTDATVWKPIAMYWNERIATTDGGIAYPFNTKVFSGDGGEFMHTTRNYTQYWGHKFLDGMNIKTTDGNPDNPPYQPGSSMAGSVHNFYFLMGIDDTTA